MRDIQSYFRQGGNKGDMSLFSHMFWKKTAQTDYLLDWTVLFDRSSSSQNGSRSAKCVRTHTGSSQCLYFSVVIFMEGNKRKEICRSVSDLVKDKTETF